MPESLALATNAGTTFSLMNTAGGIVTVSHAYPAPKPKLSTASSIDTEGTLLGSRAYENRQISLTVECFGATSETVLKNLQAHVTQIGREGGTLTWVTPAGATIIFDLLTWEDYEPTFDVGFSVAKVARVNLVFMAKPFGRGTPVTLADRVETSLPALVFTETSIPGDVPALGKLVIDEDQAVDQAWVVWGQQQRYYSSAASAALFFQAEALTAQGGSATATGATGASGTAPNVMRNTDLSPTFVSILSGQLTGGGAYLSHVGSFRVFARVFCPTSNAGTVKVALEWSEGDFRRATRNATVTFDSTWEGSFRLLDLGLVSLSEVAQGTQRWEPRILASSTVAGDEIDVDWLMFIPADEGAGEASAVFSVSAPTTFSARDEFDQAAGALAGQVAPTGGTWSGAGDANDFAVEATGKTAVRTAVSDSGSFLIGGRFARLGTGTATTVGARIDFKKTPTIAQRGVVVRYTDINNWLAAVVYSEGGSATTAYLKVVKCVAGTETTIATSSTFSVGDLGWYTVEVRAWSYGTFVASISVQGASAAMATVSGSDSVLAAGGTLASGGYGFMEFYTIGGDAGSRNFDNFAAWAPVPDAAVFASQSLELRHDRVIREDSTGTIWTKPSKYEGDYPLIPPTGPDGRANRFIVKASRNVPGQGADSGTDDISARLTVTPRFLVVPS